MGIRDFRDLIAWQLVDELRREIIVIISRSGVSKDFKYCNQIGDAVSSACRNTSEGFGRFRPSENVRFLEYARGSLNEVQDGLIEGHEKKYIDDACFDRLWTLSKRAVGANTNYQQYLRRCIRTGDKPWLNPQRKGRPDPPETEEPSEP